jgi:hypothetical protein
LTNTLVTLAVKLHESQVWDALLEGKQTSIWVR